MTEKDLLRIFAHTTRTQLKLVEQALRVYQQDRGILSQHQATKESAAERIAVQQQGLLSAELKSLEARIEQS